MFGNKLRSWMEAVRPKRKQHRKDKQNKTKNLDEYTLPKIQFFKKYNSKHSQKAPECNTKIETDLSSNGPLHSEPTRSRYSIANLSSPESAYSTGYSTDGTSPGAPPEYYTEVKARLGDNSLKSFCDKKPSIQPTSSKIASPLHENTKPVLNTAVEIASPRQRNRIRTNPWLSNSSNTARGQWPSSCSPGLPETRYFTTSNHNVTVSPQIARKPLPSSSSCSSLSGADTYWEGSEDDCTLNEMMGKYDESYVYEKETDILSDSEPTDIETDVDTGQDGGDELEPQEGDMFYIDDGSFPETKPGETKNTGHCSYFNFQEKKRTSRRKTTRKSRHKQSLSKKRTLQTQIPEKTVNSFLRSDGSRSLGATPLFSRRNHHLPMSKLALCETLGKRSNSDHLYRDRVSTIDKKDEEANHKYEELIVEAEQILRNIKTEGLSPRRIPGPANKRVELLRSAECPKVARVGDVPSTNISSLRMLPRVSLPGSIPTSICLPKSPIISRKFPERQPYQRSPKHKRKSNRTRKDITTSSSEDERPKSRPTPQSEPVKRKVYDSINKNVLSQPSNCNAPPQLHRNSAESLRHQVLINTISNLKKSLEDQSASLKKVYRSPKHCSPCI